MPIKLLKDYLDDKGLTYAVMQHPVAITAQSVAAVTHISGKELAKSVLIIADGQLLMLVLPASERVNFSALKDVFHFKEVRLAEEVDFASTFGECEVGAMPPFGNLYGIDVIVADSLTKDEDIAFNAGTHREIIKMAYADFAKLVQPRIAHFSRVPLF